MSCGPWLDCVGMLLAGMGKVNDEHAKWIYPQPGLVCGEMECILVSTQLGFGHPSFLPVVSNNTAS